MYFYGVLAGSIKLTNIVEGGYWYIYLYYATVGGVPNTTIWCVM